MQQNQFTFENACQSANCDGDLIVEPKSDESAQAKMTCTSCRAKSFTHWRNVLKIRGSTLKWLRADRRYGRAQQQGDEEAMDRIAEEMLRESKNEELLNAFRGN